MKNVPIINHSGSTSLLSAPVEEGGKKFPFFFQAVKPEERRWSYRLLPPSDAAHLTDAQLTKRLQGARPTLRAEWEEQIGHPVGLITIYLPALDGSSGARQGRCDPGPELGPTMQPLPQGPQGPTPTLEPGKAGPEPVEPDGIDMSF